MQAPPQLCCHRALSMPLLMALLMALLLVLPLLLLMPPSIRRSAKRGQRSDGHDPTTTQDEQIGRARSDDESHEHHRYTENTDAA